MASYDQWYVGFTVSRICFAYLHRPGEAFTPNVGRKALVAAGTSGLHGRATVAIWTYPEKKAGSGISVTIQRVVVIPAVSPC